jgi:ribose 5-phosphate isomerase A
MVVIADYRKGELSGIWRSSHPLTDSKVLGQQWKTGVPIEVLPLGYVSVMKQIEKLGGKPKLRMGMPAKVNFAQLAGGQTQCCVVGPAA